MSKGAYFICADDEFIASNAARELFEELTKEISDDMGKEVIEGTALTVDEACEACRKVIESILTPSMFCPKKVVWLKGANFFFDTRAGKSERTAEAIDKMASIIKSMDVESTSVIIEASPIDRRKRHVKKLFDCCDVTDLKSKDPNEACRSLLIAESKKQKIPFAPNALETLIGIVAASPRMALSEYQKLCAYLNFEGTITEKMVLELVPVFGEGDFFEFVNTFYAGNLQTSLDALRRHFFTNKNASARPIIATLQKQNSLLIQIRALLEDNAVKLGFRGLDYFDTAKQKYEDVFIDFSQKSSYNVFSQNAWYVGNILAPIAKKYPLKKLIDNQMNFMNAFSELINRPNDDEAIMRELFIKAAL